MPPSLELMADGNLSAPNDGESHNTHYLDSGFT